MIVIVGPANPPSPPTDSASAVVLDYCAAVRGILNDDQGGPLHPPGLRMAEALKEVRQSIQRNLDVKKGTSRHEGPDGIPSWFPISRLSPRRLPSSRERDRLVL